MRIKATKGDDYMYKNLSDSLNKKGISTTAAAKLLNMPEATFRTKLNDRNFTVGEAFEVRDNLFPEYDIRFLFEKS
jgi:hypothetical protein